MKSTFFTVMVSLILAGVLSVGNAMAQGDSPTDAMPVKKTVETRLECGQIATEPYDAKFTVLEVVRGKEALDRIKAANASNQPPQAGYEYVLARIAFEMKAIMAPGNKTFELARKMQFVALTEDGNEIDASLATPPKPELHRMVRAGEPAEGWIVLEVEQKNKKPVMFFDPAVGGAMGRGKILFFQLY